MFRLNKEKIRDFFRGYSKEDIKNANTKVYGFSHKAGALVLLPKKEFKAFIETNRISCGNRPNTYFETNDTGFLFEIKKGEINARL